MIAVSVFIGNTAQVSEGVADLRFSCGFIEGPLHFAGLRVERLLYDEILPVVAATHPLATLQRIDLDSLATLPLLMREFGSGTREVVSAMLEALKILPTNVMCLGNTEALKQAALEGGGIAWLRRLSMERELAAVELVPLRVPKLKIQRALNVVRDHPPHGPCRGCIPGGGASSDNTLSRGGAERAFRKVSEGGTGVHSPPVPCDA